MKKIAHDVEVMKEELFMMIAIHPHFVVEEVERHVSLMLDPVNQPSGRHLQHHPSLLNDLLLNEVPPYSIRNILEYSPIRN